MIDPHVHLRDFSQQGKETLRHGLAVASAIGDQWVFDMPNCNPPLTTRAMIERRLSAAEEAVRDLHGKIRYSVYAGITGADDEIAMAVQAWRDLFPQVVGLKLFAGNSTGGMGQVTEEAQRHIYERLAAEGYDGVLAVHCEKESLLRPDLERAGHDECHSDARPAAAETASVGDQIRLSGEAGFLGTLHIAHVSTVATVGLVEEARRSGRRITMGVTPHHLLLSRDDARDGSLHARMNPPLRSEGERKALFQALLDGRIDWVETDHAPHTLADKERGASGIPGFSGVLVLLARLRSLGVDEKRLAAWFGGNVLRTFGLSLEEGVTLPDARDTPRLARMAALAYPYDSFRNLRC